MAHAPASSPRARLPARRLGWALGLALICAGAATATPKRAHASWFVLSGSLGYGHEFHPLQAEQATNLMLTPGLTLLADMLRVELGVLATYGAVRGGLSDGFDFELRPMLRAKLPLIPIYGRLIVAGVNLFSGDRTVAYGGAVGLGLSLLGVGIFGEVGVLPRHLSDGFHWIAEGRLGASYSF